MVDIIVHIIHSTIIHIYVYDIKFHGLLSTIVYLIVISMEANGPCKETLMHACVSEQVVSWRGNFCSSHCCFKNQHGISFW
jgi:hypothetical protein